MRASTLLSLAVGSFLSWSSAAVVAQPQPAPAAPPAPTAAEPAPAPQPSPAPAEPTPALPAPPAAAPAAQPPPPPAAYNWPVIQSPAPEPERAATPSKPWTTRDLSRNFWQLSFGVRNSWIGNAGFDPFATTDSLTQVSIGGTRALFVSGDLSFAAGVMLEGGSRHATARGADSSIYVLRPGVVIEGRYHLHRDLYASLKLVPHAARVSTSIEEASAAATLEQVDWRFGMDASAGVAWNFVRTLGGNVVPGWWLWTDVGYGFTQSKDIVLKADTDDSLGSKQQLGLGPLALNGVLLRVGVALTF